ncbi:hypothetical protein B0T26DRAFT_699002 [Lasiosphaeria miniovina]|uniref:CCZ1/INTU/HSP4 first Longin domain-containing protein n=1 Tax=Lasiosphaeria miniovina TaxID=1954250 RepID=A0AA40B7B9_9PEZI|nr:uncharacterized protein B0T26DRAFT_699002 [Lasiosphaeria miniovina]KAK0728693.1 hypothetical protein B0T26DRAFT_699002 [Lasiosphaeria miniovina]
MAAVTASPSASSIVPAQLGFLSIYNPSLGATDETIDDQIVYYASVSTQTGQKRRRHRYNAARPTENLSKEERNERLRHIGLAQGMVEFGKSFSGGMSVDTIDTERSRVVLHELEPGWWILASIDLTRLPLPPSRIASTSPPVLPGRGQAPEPSKELDEKFEYSSREVKPAALLLQDLLRAHSVFLLHHDSSLSALFVRSQRAKFASVLDRYWDQFLTSWNVLLHGNPACNVLGGIKIAACGELGIGVGEEERGSGEREVLESLVNRVEGLVDLVVSKFGEDNLAIGEKEPAAGKGLKGDLPSDDDESWLGTGNETGAEDGAVFLGIGALSKHSLRGITNWMEDMYTWGDNAYGVTDSPTATRSQMRNKRTPKRGAVPPQPLSAGDLQQSAKAQPGSADSQAPKDSQNKDKRKVGSSEAVAHSSHPEESTEASGGGMDKLFSYLKLGYGTSWTLSSSALTEVDGGKHHGVGEGGDTANATSSHKRPTNATSGHFLIGLKGDIDGAEMPVEQEDSSSPGPTEVGDTNPRILLRTLTVELDAEAEDRPESRTVKDLGRQDAAPAVRNVGSEGSVTAAAGGNFDSQDVNKIKKLRVVVYVNQPFMFVFLFQLRTESLSWESFYRSLHSQLVPVRKPLLTSTAYRPGKPDVGSSVSAQIHDLVWDPQSLTIHSTIPNIPEPAALPGVPYIWSRIEALNTHNQILNMFMSTREDLSEFERTCKTSRGWWVVWNRILEQAPPRDVKGRGVDRQETLERRRSDESEVEDSDGLDEDDQHEQRLTPRQELVVSKEIFLIRKASDHASAGGVRGVSASYIVPGAAAGGWADGASRLAQGIGVDTRRYIEGLLSMNR